MCGVFSQTSLLWGCLETCFCFYQSTGLIKHPWQGRLPAHILLGPCHSVPFADRWLGAVSSASLCSPIDPVSSTVALSLPLPKDQVLHHGMPCY